jgi:CBS domain-containing protein
MKVREIMTERPQACGPETNLATAVEIMWRNDCGAVAVVENGKLRGIITDRDICIALGTRNWSASDIAVKDVASYGLHTCGPNDNVSTALAIMRRARVRRLPVVDVEGTLEGIVTLTDILLSADSKPSAIDYGEVISTIKTVSEHRGRQPVEAMKTMIPPVPAVVG